MCLPFQLFFLNAQLGETAVSCCQNLSEPELCRPKKSPRRSIHRHLVACRCDLCPGAPWARGPAPVSSRSSTDIVPGIIRWWYGPLGTGGPRHEPHHCRKAGLRLCSNLCARRQLADFPTEKRVPSWEMPWLIHDPRVACFYVQ